MNALLLAAPALLALATGPAVQEPSADDPTTARVTGTMIVKHDTGSADPAPGVRVTLMAVRRNAEGLLEAALEGLKDCPGTPAPAGQEPYGFCTAMTNAEGRFAFEGVKPGLSVLTSSKEAASARKLPTFGKRAVCELRAGMTVDVGRVEVDK